MGRGRISGLDGVRGLAACGVAFFVHFFHIGGVRQDGPLFEAFGWVYTRGETLVDLFFVLSGFVICHACSHVEWRAFATQRFARLYPLHLATLAAAAALLVFGRSLAGPLALDYDTDVGRALLQLSLTHAWVIADNRFGFNAPSWSISVEAACYVLFALKIRSRFALGLSAILVLVGISGIFTPWLSRGLVGFFMGVIVCRELPRLSRLPTWALCVGAAAGVALMSLPPAPTRAAFLVAGIWAWPLVILLALRAPVSRWLDNPVLRWLGDRSYGIYMIHTPRRSPCSWRTTAPSTATTRGRSCSASISRSPWRLRT